MIKEIIALIKNDDLDILFRMDSGYFDDEIISTIESAGCQYLIKGKAYRTLASQIMLPSTAFTLGKQGRETIELFTKLDTRENERRFVISRVLKANENTQQISFLDEEYEYFYFVTNTGLSAEEIVIAYEKRGNAENYIKEAKYDMAAGRLLLHSF